MVGGRGPVFTVLQELFLMTKIVRDTGLIPLMVRQENNANLLPVIRYAVTLHPDSDPIIGTASAILENIQFSGKYTCPECNGPADGTKCVAQCGKDRG